VGLLQTINPFSRPKTSDPKNTSLADYDWWLNEIFKGKNAKSGVTVSPLTALGVPTVFACVNHISKDVGKLPLKLYRRSGASKEEAYDHPLYSLFHDAPNSEMTSIDFRKAMQSNLSLRQNAVAYIVRDGRGEVAEVYPVDPADLKLHKEKNQPLEYWIDGKRTDPSRILHLKGFTSNGVAGIEVVKLVEDVIGLAVALQDNASRFFGNGSRPGSILSHPGSLTDKAYQRLKEEIHNKHGGVENAYKTMILEEGLKYEQSRTDNDKSQFIESRKHQDIAICQVFGVQPHKVGILDRATFSNIEQQNIEYVVDTLLPELRTWEQALNAKLLKPQERGEYFFEFNVDGQLRGDFKTRMEGYAIARQNGWMNADEIRALENMNPLPDGLGQRYLEPLNMVPAGEERSE
jgi:HK97 family phage portal protein